MYRTIVLKPRVLSSMFGIARSPSNAYKHTNSVLYDNCERMILHGRSGMLGDALGRLWNGWNTYEMLWGALMCSETLEGVLKRSELLWDPLGRSKRWGTL